MAAIGAGGRPPPCERGASALGAGRGKKGSGNDGEGMPRRWSPEAGAAAPPPPSRRWDVPPGAVGGQEAKCASPGGEEGDSPVWNCEALVVSNPVPRPVTPVAGSA